MNTALRGGDATERLPGNPLLLKIAGRVARLGGWSFDTDSQRLVWSDETCKIHDRPAGYQPLLHKAIDCYLPEYREMVLDTVNRCLQEGTPFDFEAELITARNRKIWVRAVGEAVRNSDGRISGFQGAFQDITTQHGNEVERHALATELSATLENMSDAFFTLDRHWAITYVNEEMTRRVNRPREDMLHQRIWDVFPGTENSRFHACYQRAIDTGTVAIDVACYEPLGKWFEVQAHPAEDGVAVYFQDATQKRRDEEQLRLIQACVERMNDIVVVTQAEAITEHGPLVLYVNPTFERHTGYTPAEIVGRSPGMLEGSDRQTGVHERVRDYLARREPGREEILSLKKNGDEIWLERDIVPIVDAAGGLTHWIWIERNVTGRKRSEEALRQKDNLLKVGSRVGKVGGWTA